MHYWTLSASCSAIAGLALSPIYHPTSVTHLTNIIQRNTCISLTLTAFPSNMHNMNGQATWNEEYFEQKLEDRRPGHHIGNSHCVEERIDGVTKTLEIAFVCPSVFFGENYLEKFDRAQVSACITGYVYSREKFPLPGLIRVGRLVHMLRRREGLDGVVKHVLLSRFFLGNVLKSPVDYPISGPITNFVGNTLFYRRTQLTESVAHGLFRHCAEEMEILREMLPKLYCEAFSTCEV